MNDDKPWTCPHCGNNQIWFDRSIHVLYDGTQEGPFERCTECGIEVGARITPELMRLVQDHNALKNRKPSFFERMRAAVKSINY